MRAFHSLFARCIPAVLTTLAAALLTACGGGSGSDLAGVGSGGSGVASGSVSGFGSVIVDGVEYDDSTATRDTEDATGASVNAAIKLGQRVRLVYAGDKVAQRIEVQAQLVGPVSAAPAADGSMTVMGQRVRVVASASDATRSSPTVLDGYAAAADIRAGDEVEVHGAWAYDAALASNVLVATRFEKRPTPPDPVQLGGVVTAIDGATLRLEVEQEISSIAPSAGVNAQAVDLVTNKRSIKSVILADDGQVIVLGGLIQDDVTSTDSKVPLLGDIPLIGRLFRSTKDTHIKRNLMVFLRPTVVRDRAGMATLSGKKFNDISVLGADEDGNSTLPGDAMRLFDKPGAAAIDLRKAEE